MSEIALTVWDVKPLSQFAEARRGITYSSAMLKSEEGGLPYINMKSFLKGGGFNVEGTKHYAGTFTQQDIVGECDLLIANTDVTSGDIIGVPALLPEVLAAEQVLYSHHVTRLRINGEISVPFLYYLLCLPEYRSQMLRIARGTTVLMLDMPAIKRVTICAPKNKTEQGCIVEILSTLDTAIEKTESLIAKYQQIKAGLIHGLFTRGVTADGKLRPPREQAPELYQQTPIGWIPKVWDVVELKSEIGITHGFAFSGEYFSDTPPGEILLTPGNFHRDGGLYFTVENTKYFQGTIPPTTVLPNGEMVTVMTDLSPQTLILGRFAIIETPFLLLHNQRIGRVILKRKDCWDWSYLCYALNNERIRRKIIVEATGTTVRHTSPTRILSNQVARPHLEEQRRSVEVIRSLERQLVEEQALLLKNKQLKLGLMFDLLTGKVRVKPDVKTQEMADG